MNKTEIYCYDLAGNIYKHWSDYADGDIKNTEYLTKTNYTSDVKYIQNKEYKKDKDTTIKEKNNCALGIMKSRNIYENYILKYKAEYEHDEYGNVVKEKKYKTSMSYDSTDIVYDSNHAYPIT